MPDDRRALHPAAPVFTVNRLNRHGKGEAEISGRALSWRDAQQDAAKCQDMAQSPTQRRYAGFTPMLRM